MYLLRCWTLPIATLTGRKLVQVEVSFRMSSPEQTHQPFLRRFTVPFLVLCLYGLSIGINMYRYTRGRYALYPVLAGRALLAAKTFVGMTEVSYGLLLLPVSRACVTRLRSTWVDRVIYLDWTYYYHKGLAVTGLIVGTAHGLCATTAYINIGLVPASTQAAVGREPKDVRGMLFSWNVLSGWTMFIILVNSYLFVMKWPRLAPWLKDTNIGIMLNNRRNFWIVKHILFLVFLPTAIVHSMKFTPGFIEQNTPAKRLSGTKFLYYIAVPLIIYICDRVYRVSKGCLKEPPKQQDPKEGAKQKSHNHSSITMVANGVRDSAQSVEENNAISKEGAGNMV